MDRAVRLLAPKHAYAKFMAIESTQCIPNYPDKNVPTLLLYRAGELVTQVVGLDAEGWGGAKGFKAEKLEKSLMKRGMLERLVLAAESEDSILRDEEDEERSYRKTAIVFK